MELILLIAGLIITYFTGTRIEKSHINSIEERELSLTPVPFLTNADLENLKDIKNTTFVNGCVVIGADFFRFKLSQLVSLFGGNIAGLESLLVRARREAMLRLRNDAPDADAFVDVQYTTTMLNNKDSGSALPIVEVYIYGTAVYLNK